MFKILSWIRWKSWSRVTVLGSVRTKGFRTDSSPRTWPRLLHSEDSGITDDAFDDSDDSDHNCLMLMQILRNPPHWQVSVPPQTEEPALEVLPYFAPEYLEWEIVIFSSQILCWAVSNYKIWKGGEKNEKCVRLRKGKRFDSPRWNCIQMDL